MASTPTILSSFGADERGDDEFFCIRRGDLDEFDCFQRDEDEFDTYRGDNELEEDMMWDDQFEAADDEELAKDDELKFEDTEFDDHDLPHDEKSNAIFIQECWQNHTCPQHTKVHQILVASTCLYSSPLLP